MSIKFNIFRGKKQDLPSSLEQGAFYVTTDEGKLYMDVNNERVTLNPLESQDIGTSKALVSDANGKVAASSVTNTQLGYLSGVANSLKITSATGNNAFTYNTATTAGLLTTADYSSSMPRRVFKIGGIANLSFHSQGSSSANGANWTYVGTIASGYRPKYQTPITAIVYNNGTNEAAGGHIATNGQVVIWTNPKVAGNNYQVRVNASYLI